MINRQTDGPAIIERLQASIFADKAEEVFHYSNCCYVRPLLPFAFDGLEPLYPRKILEAHYELHGRFACMLNGVRTRLWQARAAGDWSAMKIYSRLLTFTRSEHILHCLLWNCLEPGGKEMPPELDQALTGSFGSTKDASSYFASYAHAAAGRGWVVLAHDTARDKLTIFKTGELVNMAFWPATPLAALDLWEHAYSRKAGLKRHDWIEAFMKLINWKFVGRRYLLSRGAGGNMPKADAG